MHAPLDYSPDVLAHEARRTASSFGYPKRPADSTVSIESRDEMVASLMRLSAHPHWDDWFASESPIQAVYRESLAPMVADPYGEISASNPAPTEPGMLRIALDGGGRLRDFQGHPYKDAQPLATPVAPSSVFQAAGLDMATFTEIPATFVPVVPASEAHSWKGPHPHIPGLNLIVDMATWQGRLTEFAVHFDWPKSAAAQPENAVVSRVRGVALTSLMAIGCIAMIALARRNWRLGHVDRKGALRIGAARVLLGLVAWIGSVHPVPDESMIFFFFASAAAWLTWGAALALLYIALEPLVRARWPHSIMTWGRLLTGRWLDPQVGSHILIGATIGAVVWTAAQWFGDWQNPGMDTPNLFSAIGLREWVAVHTSLMEGSLLFGLVVFFSICGLRMLVKKDVPAALLAALLLIVSNGGVFHSTNWKVTAIIYFGVYSALVFVLLRFGLVTTIAATFFLDSFNLIILGADWKTWYAPAGLASLLFLLSIAIFAFWRSLGSHELFGREANP